jgi:hypothetical protein
MSDMYIACLGMFMFLFCYFMTEAQPAAETKIYKNNIFVKLLKLNANVNIFFFCYLFLWYLNFFL